MKLITDILTLFFIVSYISLFIYVYDLIYKIDYKIITVDNCYQWTILLKLISNIKVFAIINPLSFISLIIIKYNREDQQRELLSL